MQKVIIIGATSGIGEALAKIYHDQHFLVGITGRRKELLDSFQKKFPDIATECFDVTGNDNIKHVTSLIAKLGGMDILIYNSGYGEPSKKLSWEIEKQTTLTNVNGFAEIINFAFNFFAKQGHGQLAGISSIAANRGNSWAPAYSASKAYMSTYLEGLHMKAFKLKLPVYVTDIQPGFVNTKMAKGNKQFWVSQVEKAAEQIYRSIRAKRKKAYITKRWWIIAKIMRYMPHWIYKRIA